MKDSITDLRIVVDGFLDLAQASAKEAAAQAKAAPAPSNASPAAASSVPRVPQIYDADAAGVAGPVAIRQDVPSVPIALVKTVRPRGRLEVTIETDGHVSNVVVVESMNSAYDAMVASAARHWRYKPAMKDGAAVRFLKTIVLSINGE